MNKKQLYENIMKNVQKELNNVLNEEKELSPSEKMDAWHNGERDENIKACGADKLKKYKAICQAKGYDAEVAALQAEIDKRGLKESAIFENEEPDIREKYGDEFADLVGGVDDGAREINTEKDSEFLDLSKLTPWNSREYPVLVNSIRYNQDYSLLTLGTSKGYKIFLTSNLLHIQSRARRGSR